MKEKIISYTSSTLNRKTTLIFIFVFTTIIIFDTTIVSFSSYSGVEFPTWLNVMIFVVFAIIFLMGSMILLNSVRKIVTKYSYKPAPRGLMYFQGIIISTITLTGVIILIIIFQMLLLNNYSIVLLQVQTYVSHFSALVFLPSCFFVWKLVILKKELHNSFVRHIVLASLFWPYGCTYLSRVLFFNLQFEFPWSNTVSTWFICNKSSWLAVYRIVILGIWCILFVIVLDYVDSYVYLSKSVSIQAGQDKILLAYEHTIIILYLSFPKLFRRYTLFVNRILSSIL